MDQLFVSNVVAEKRARLDRVRRAWAAYFGGYPKRLKRARDGFDDNVAVNFVKIAADKSAMALFGDGFSFEVAGDESERTPLERWLDDVFAAAGGEAFWLKVALNGAVTGDAFVKIAPQANGLPRLINISPEYVDVLVDPLDIDVETRIVIEFPAVGADGKPTAYRQIMQRAEDGASWTIEDYEARGLFGWRMTASVTWPHPWPPLVHCQNLPSPNEYYGVADADVSLLDLNDMLNFTLSNIQRIVRLHAHPRTWGSGFSAEALNVGPDATIVLPPGATLQNLEMKSDLQSAMQHYRNLREALHEIAALPEVALGKLERTGAVSGVALRILHQPLIDRIKQKRMLYGAMLRTLIVRLAALSPFSAQVSESDVTISWPELDFTPPLERLQAALQALQLGVSRETLLRELGYNPEAEAERKLMEAPQAAELFAQAFGAGV